MNEAQAVPQTYAGNEKIKTWDELMADHRAQVIAELAAKTGVMPEPFTHGGDENTCDADEAREALAIMQAKLEQAQADAARMRDALEEVLAYCTESGHDWMCMVDARSALAAMKEQK